MGPNLRSLVTKANRVRQGRTFSSSSAPNPIVDKGKGCGIDSVLDTMNRLAPWFVVGFSVKFYLDMSALLKSFQKSEELHQAYMREWDL